MNIVISLQHPDKLNPEVRDELEQIISSIQKWADNLGKWVDEPYAVALYGQNDGLWTVEQGDQKSFRWTVIGDTMILQVAIVGSATNANVDEELHLYLPAGYVLDLPRTTVPVFVGSVTWFDNTGGSSGTGLVMINFQDNVVVNNRRIALLRNINGVAWPASSSDLAVSVYAILPVIAVP